MYMYVLVGVAHRTCCIVLLTHNIGLCYANYVYAKLGHKQCAVDERVVSGATYEATYTTHQCVTPVFPWA